MNAALDAERSGIDSVQAIITHRSEASRKTERYRRKCLEQLYFELSEMQVHQVTLESRQEAQNRKDIEHIVALQAQGQSPGVLLQSWGSRKIDVK